MKKENLKIIGFKGFDKDFKCKDKQYSENQTFEETLTPEICSKEMHFCELPLNVFDYYAPDGKNQFAIVEAEGDIVHDDDKQKSAANKLHIKTKLSIGGLFKAHFELILNKIKANKETTNTSGNYAHANTSGNYAHANTSGYKAHANTSGYYAHANTSGYYAHANTSGDYAHANTSGYYAHANTSGDYAHANTSGNYAHANTSGNYAHANTSGYKAHANTSGYKAHANTSGNHAHANTSGDYAHANTSGNYAHANTSGNEAIASSLGIKSKSKSINGWIIIVDWRQDENHDWHIHEIYRAKAGKHKIKGELIQPDTWYWFENGQLKSEK